MALCSRKLFTCQSCNNRNRADTPRYPRPAARLLWLACAWLLSCSTWATPTININNLGTNPVSLKGSLEYFAPGIQRPSINDILVVNDYHWKPDNTQPVSFALAPRQTLWYRIQISNTGNNVRELTLYNTNPASDWLEAYTLAAPASSGQYSPNVIKLPHHNRDLHTIRFTSQSYSVQTLYIAISGFHGGQAPLNLVDTRTYEQMNQQHQWHAGLIDGAILGLMIYNLLLWHKTRQTMYMAYMLLGLFNILTIATHQGLLTRFIPVLSDEWNTNLSLTFPLNVSQCLVFFFQHFLETRKHYPRLHLLLNGYIVFTLMIAALFLLGVPMIVTTPLFFSISTAAIFMMLRTAYLHSMHSRTVRWLLLAGLGMPIISGMITVLAASSVTFFERDYMAFMQMADVMEMLLLSAAMAYKVSQLQHEHNDQISKAAKESITNAAHNRLLAHINHEFRTPLNGILGATELLIGKSEKYDSDTINMIYQTALPLKILVDDLVNINAISENRKQLIKTRFDIEQLLQECTDIFMPAARKQGIRLYFSVDNTIPSNVNSDPYRLRQIILNLLGNAFKFTHNGIIGVRVSRENTTSIYRFDIYDSGRTITADIQEKLFQQFEKGSTPSELPGAGLGLSIVKELSRAMGGDCGYLSGADGIAGYPSDQKGHGNLFWFTVHMDPYLPIKRTTHTLFEHRRILIADKNLLIADQLEQALGNQHALLEKADNCEKLYSLAISKHFDIAIVQQALIDENFEHSALEDIPSVCTYIDSHEFLQDRASIYPVITRPISMRKFIFNIANTLAVFNTTHKTRTTTENDTSLYKVLVAEDNPTSQIIISEILKRFPLTVDICSNGKEAEQAYRNMVAAGTPYQAIFMDCEMPLQDGFQTTRKIRQYEKQHAIKNTFITALTAHNEVTYKLKSREAGMDDFLSKPISIESISLCIQKAGLSS